MPPRKYPALLQDVRLGVEALLSPDPTPDAQRLRSDWILRSAIERQLLIIGEALARIRREHPKELAHFPDGSAIIGMRNILCHAYEIVEVEQLAAVLENDLDPLHQQVLGALAQESPGGGSHHEDRAT